VVGCRHLVQNRVHYGAVVNTVLNIQVARFEVYRGKMHKIQSLRDVTRTRLVPDFRNFTAFILNCLTINMKHCDQPKRLKSLNTLKFNVKIP